VLADVDACDVLIADPPYSPTTHNRRQGASMYEPEKRRNDLTYSAITCDDVAAFVSSWAPRVRHWVVLFGDSVSFYWWREAWSGAGWATFAPVVWRKTDAPPRFSGDGPTSSCEYIAVARPRRRLASGRTGSRPGDYCARTQVGGVGGASGVVGTKDPEAMRRLVGDYTRRGDTLVDPFCGWGTTALAARAHGVRCVTSEVSPDSYRKTLKRLGGLPPEMARPGETPDLFAKVTPYPHEHSRGASMKEPHHV
jgi:hypothetical protein